MAAKKLRTSDGRPERRNLDEIIKEALEREDLSQLPGWGKPIDLKDYFSSGPEHRAANKILQDNKVLPLPLQERKDAESLQEESSAYRAREEQFLAALQRDIDLAAQSVSAPFPDRRTLLEVFGLETWPAYLPEPANAPLPRRAELRHNAQTLLELVTRYNRRVEVVIAQYLDLLGRANTCIDRLNTQVFFSHHLPPQLQLRGLNLEREEEEVRAHFPPLTTLPQDLAQRLEAYCKAVCPSVWRRLGRSFSRT